MTLLSIDPGRSYKGDKTIGYCLFENWGDEIRRGSLSFEELCKDLGFDHIGVFFQGRAIHSGVIEDFVNDPKSARGGQRNGTSECIGAVEYAFLKGETELTRQKNTILPVAKLQAGYVDTHKHLPHPDSAYLHGYYYLVSKGVLKPAGLENTL